MMNEKYANYKQDKDPVSGDFAVITFYIRKIHHVIFTFLLLSLFLVRNKSTRPPKKSR